MAKTTATGLRLLIALLCACVLRPQLAGAAITARESANNAVADYPASRVANGGTQGRIPISYVSNTTRTGWYFLPEGYEKRILPVMVILHGSGMNGFDMLNAWRDVAAGHKFALIAPDSENELYWKNSQPGQPFTVDWEHVEACYKWVSTLSGVWFNKRKVAYAGFSRGGYAAGALATRVGRATHSLIFHSLMHYKELGRNIVPIWISSGRQDPLFNPRRVLVSVKALKAHKPQLYGHIATKFFKGGHSPRIPAELNGAVGWWFRH